MNVSSIIISMSDLATRLMMLNILNITLSMKVKDDFVLNLRDLYRLVLCYAIL